jgi:hypothetical protein
MGRESVYTQIMHDPGRLALLGIVAIGLGAWALWTIYYVPQALPPQPQVTPVAYAVLASGERSGVVLRKNYLISSESELRELWKLISTNSPPPSIDFETESVIAVFAGTKPTAGYSIAVTGIADADRRVVSIEVIEPGVSCLAAPVETTAYQVLKVPKTALSWTHQNTGRVVGCLR